MPERTFEKILSGIKKSKFCEVMLSPDIGEPLLAPNFIDKVKRLRQSGVKLIELTTNSSLFHKVGIEAMLREGPDKINISFPGFDEKMYERICRAPFYQQTKANILDILRTNQKMGRPKEINLWLRGDMEANCLINLPEMKKVKELANEIQCMSEVDNFGGIIKKEVLTEGLKVQSIKPSITKRPCVILFGLTIHPDGNIHLCPCRNIVSDPALHIGNIQKTDLFTAHLKINEVLKAWAGGNIPEICKKCSMYCDPAEAVLGRFKRIAARNLFNKWYF